MLRRGLLVFVVLGLLVIGYVLVVASQRPDFDRAPVEVLNAAHQRAQAMMPSPEDEEGFICRTRGQETWRCLVTSPVAHYVLTVETFEDDFSDAPIAVVTAARRVPKAIG